MSRCSVACLIFFASAIVHAQDEIGFGEQYRRFIEKYPSKPWISLWIGNFSPQTLSATRIEDFALKDVLVGKLHTFARPFAYVMAPLPESVPDLAAGNRERALPLLGTLTKDQWQALSGVGLQGKSLAPEQQRLWRRLLPTEVVWNESAPKGQGRITGGAKGSLRIRARKVLEWGFQGDFAQTFQQARKSGSWVTTPSEFSFADDSEFGFDVDQAVPAGTQPTQLDKSDARLQKVISLAKSQLCRELVERVKTSSGVTFIVPDDMASVDVGSSGGKATCWEIMQALAVQTSGTFRKLGEDYVLTSDLQGRGQRALEQALWRAPLLRRQEELLKTMKAKVASLPYWQNIQADAAIESALTPQLRANADSNSKVWDKQSSVSLASLPPLLQGQIQKYKSDITRYDPKATFSDKVYLAWAYKYQIVLPDGRALDRLEPLFETRMFVEPTETQIPVSAPTEAVALAKGSGIMVRLSSGFAAAQALNLAQRKGAEELWIQSNEAKAVADLAKKAIALGIKVRWVVNPWSLGSRIETKNLLGEGPMEALKHFRAVSPAHPTILPPLPHYLPGSKAMTEAWQAFNRELVSLPQEVGIVLESPIPLGVYAYDDGTHRLPIGELHFALLNVCYTLEARQRYAEYYDADPIDLQFSQSADYDPVRRELFDSGEVGPGDDPSILEQNPHRAFADLLAEQATEDLTSLLASIDALRHSILVQTFEDLRGSRGPRVLRFEPPSQGELAFRPNPKSTSAHLLYTILPDHPVSWPKTGVEPLIADFSQTPESLVEQLADKYFKNQPPRP